MPKLTPMLIFIVCPSLKPRSSLGVLSCKVESASASADSSRFTHLPKKHMIYQVSEEKKNSLQLMLY